ncbi:MAG: tyrosine-type recombinase/integrase [Oscillospiraceae bacterium]|nr:tyrosine-type recombinase/integrase [Oscillospiraceae bacterium]
MKQLNTPGSLSFQMSDLVVLFEHGGFENAEVKNMITKAKEKFVASHHSYVITQMHSKSKYKDGYYKTYVCENGKRKEVVRKTKAELIDYLFDLYKTIENSTRSVESTFELLMARKEEELNRSSSTIRDDRRYFSYLDKDLQAKPLAEVTDSDLRRWLVKDYLPKKPKEAALKKMLQLLKQIFDYGMRKGFCIRNPAQFILFDDYAKDCDLKKKQSEERKFSQAELDRLRQDALKTCKNPRSLMRLFAMVTGLRVGELSAFLWSDVNDNYIHIHRQQVIDTSDVHQVFRDVEYTKDERKHPHGGRVIPRTKEIDEVLALAKQLPGTPTYVFHDKAGKPIKKDSYLQNLRRACRRLGITTTNNHAFRIAFNSELIEKELSPADRAMILGHAVETNEHYYSVSDRRRLEEISRKMK